MKVNNYLSSQMTDWLTNQPNNHPSDQQRGAEFEKSTVPQVVEELMHFMEPEDALQCLQESANWPYPDPDRPIPHPPVLFLDDSF